MSASSPNAPRASSDGAVRTGLVLVGVSQLALAAVIVIAPRDFFDALGPFGDFNQHYLQDLAAFHAAIGAAALIALPRPRWWGPVLTVAALDYAFHSVSHLVDVTEADPEVVGYVDLAALVAVTALLAMLARAAERRVRTPR